MNKIYKVVWSKVKNCYVVVSELAKNVISGSVKSAKVGASPMVKGMALGALVAFMITGNAWAADSVKSGYEYTEMNKMTELKDVSVLGITIKLSSISNSINGLVEITNAMGSSLDALDDNILVDSGKSTTITTTLTVNGLTTLSDGLNVTGNVTASGSVTASDFIIPASEGTEQISLSGVNTAYQSADSALSEKITANEIAINAIDEAYKAADTELGKKIDTNATNISANKSAIAKEVTDRETADTTLSEKIDKNTTAIGDRNYTSTNYIASDDSLTAAAGKLDAQAKVNADAIAKEVTDRETAIAGVTTAYKVADSALETKISTNASAINANTDAITTLNNHVTKHTESINALKTNVSTNTSSITALTESVNQNQENIALKANAADVYTKEVADDTFATITTVSNVREDVIKNKGEIQTLTTTVGGHTTSITELQGTVGDLSEGKADKATTLAGYGIGDAYTKQEIDNKFAATGTAEGATILANKTQNIDANKTVASKTYFNGAVEVEGNVQAATFNGIDLKASLDKKIDNVATGYVAIGIGKDSVASGLSSVGIGYKANATDTNAIGIGRESKATGNGAIGIGGGAEAIAEKAIVVGSFSKASGYGSVGIGTEAQASGKNSIAIGVGYPNSGLALLAKGESSIAIGTAASAEDDCSTAVGNWALAKGKNSLALGSGAKANYENSVALGAGSVTTAADTVSFGNATTQRKLQYVAAGEVSENSTDAVVGSQLYATNERVGALEAKTAGISRTQYSSTVDTTGTGETKVTDDFVVDTKEGNGKVTIGYIGENEMLFTQNEKGDYTFGVNAQTGAMQANGGAEFGYIDTVDGNKVYNVEMNATGVAIKSGLSAVGGKVEVKAADDESALITVNAGTENQVVIGATGITVGLNSTHMDNAGVYAGGHNYNDAYAAIMADGGIKGANGAFSVDASGNVTAVTYNGVKIEDLVAADKSNADAITKVETDYKAADKALKTEVTDAYTKADSALETKVTDAYTQADATLKSEVEQGYKAADAKLQKDIAANTEAISGLNDRVTTNESDIAQNAADIEALDGRVTVNETAIKQNAADIEANKTAIENNENAIKDMDAAYKAADKALKTEVTDAYTKADSALETKVTDAYTKADSALETKVTDAYTQADATLKSEVEQGYKAADAKLQKDIAANTEAISGLNDRVTVNETAIAQNAADIAANKTAIENNEKAIKDMDAAYKAADKTLQDNIDAEKAAREAADAKTLTDAKAYADEKETALNNKISDVEAAYKEADKALEGKIADVADAYVAADEALKKEVEAGYKEADAKLQTQVDAVKQQAALNDRVNQVQNTQIAQLQSENIAQDNAIAGLEKTKADKTYVDEKDAALKAEVEAGYKAADEQTLADAKGYADEKAAEVTEAYTKADDAIKADVKANADNIAANADAIATHAEAINNNSEAISGLNQRLGKMNGKINKVGAGAAALAALHPLDYDPDDKLTFSAGVGNYAGENAAALGAFYRPDEKLMFSLGGTMGNGENMVNLGVSIGLDGAKGAPKLSRKEMIEKVSTVEAENKNLKAENEALAERVARLERIVVALTEKEQAK